MMLVSFFCSGSTATTMPRFLASGADALGESTSCFQASSCEKPSGTLRAPPLPNTMVLMPSTLARSKALIHVFDLLGLVDLGADHLQLATG